MPWKEQDLMSLREEFVRRARCKESNISALCREFGISRTAGYKWLERAAQGGPDALKDRSRRPHSSPNETLQEVVDAVLMVRDAHLTWGPRKIRAYLVQKGRTDVPCPSTIGKILRRYAMIDPDASSKHDPPQFFEREKPNELWQMDFKGQFRLALGGYCHPLSILDDHSRFVVGLYACADQKYQTVQQVLTTVFQKYGLPERMLMDNGSPWGDDRNTRHTILTAWLIRYGIHISHGKPYHPQTQGKIERYHRTLKEDLLQGHVFADLPGCQSQFNRWLQVYNEERPHEAIGLIPPSQRYEKSERAFPEELPPIIYKAGDILRKVDAAGKIYYNHHSYRVGKAFRHQLVALRPSKKEDQFDIYYCAQRVALLDLDNPLS